MCAGRACLSSGNIRFNDFLEARASANIWLGLITIINDVKPAPVQPFYLVAHGDNVVWTICKSNLRFASQTASSAVVNKNPRDREGPRRRPGSVLVAGDQSLTDTRCGEWAGGRRGGGSQDARHEAWLHFLIPSLWRRHFPFFLNSDSLVSTLCKSRIYYSTHQVYIITKVVFNKSITLLCGHKLWAVAKQQKQGGCV